ncbi:hypothetical protein, partial [Erwinia amylovora]
REMSGLAVDVNKRITISSWLQTYFLNKQEFMGFCPVKIGLMMAGARACPGDKTSYGEMVFATAC